MEFSLEQVAQVLGGNVEGDPSAKVNTLSKIQEGKPGSLAFLANPKYESFIYETNATAVIVNEDFKPKNKIKASLIRVKDAYAGFTTLLEFYQKALADQNTGIEEPSFIGKNSKTGENIYRGAFSYIGRDCIIGDNVKIFPNAHIGNGVELGDGTVIHPGVRILDNCKIGGNCFIQAGAVIGSDGFGYAPTEDGSYKNIPQLGNVVLEDDVHIGANTTIDRATMMGDSTIIKKGTKLDNLIQIAHNVSIGKDTVVAAQTGISGSASVGNNCVIAGQVGIVGHVNVANRVIVGAQAGLSKNIKENKILLGSPAFDQKEYKKSYVVFKNLPDLNDRINKLEEIILNLPTVYGKSEE